MTTFDEILARTSLPTDVVRLCLDGAAMAEIRELERQLAGAATVPTSLAERAPASVIAEQIEQLREAMRGSEVEITLRAIPAREWTPLYASAPDQKQGEASDAFAQRWFTWMAELVSRTVVDPAMTPEQVGQLVDRLPAASWVLLSDAAWLLNTGKVAVPFSAAASAMISAFAEMSKLPSESVTPTAGGGAASRPKRPRTSTTKKPAA